MPDPTVTTEVATVFFLGGGEGCGLGRGNMDAMKSPRKLVSWSSRLRSSSLSLLYYRVGLPWLHIRPDSGITLLSDVCQ